MLLEDKNAQGSTKITSYFPRKCKLRKSQTPSSCITFLTFWWILKTILKNQKKNSRNLISLLLCQFFVTNPTCLLTMSILKWLVQNKFGVIWAMQFRKKYLTQSICLESAEGSSSFLLFRNKNAGPLDTSSKNIQPMIWNHKLRSQLYWIERNVNNLKCGKVHKPF